MKRPYRIVVGTGRPYEWWWTLLSPGGVAIADSANSYDTKASAKRAARNVVLAMCTRPVIIEEEL